MSDLERFWFELQREMTESGRIARFKTKIVSRRRQAARNDGRARRAVQRHRCRPTTSSTCRRRSSSRSWRASRRATYRSAAKRLEEASEGYVSAVVDPTRGVLLSIYAQRPNVIERIQRGESVGYVIILVGVVGAMLAIYQFFYLATVRGKVRNQLQIPGCAGDRQPAGPRAGRPSRATRSGSKDEDAEVVELRISEAVLNEVPKLERFQSFLRLAVAAGPLLGLIGTVVGMIITFQSITESGSSDPKLMAAGMSQAMIATRARPRHRGAAAVRATPGWPRSRSGIVQILDEQSTGCWPNASRG